MRKFKIPENYNFYDYTSYGDEIPYLQFYLLLFDTLPSKLFTKITFSTKIIDFFIKNGFVEEVRMETLKKENKITSAFLKKYDVNYTNSERIFINYDKEILIKTVVKKDDINESILVYILYNFSKGEISSQIDLNELNKYHKVKESANIHLVKSEMGSLDTEEYELRVPETDLELNYGKSFIKINDLIVRRLNQNNDKGIILLHGDPGTGKTSYIKYLTKQVKDKEILFIPPSMAETLSEPSIIPFLMDHKNSILIIEDAERVISDREFNGSSAGVSNILNLTDGILGDCLSIQIIATFNMKREKIDQALLRKGRLIVEHKFIPLTVTETNKLLKHLKKDYVSNSEMTLADIYNIDVEQYRTENNQSKIGF